jgi:hypothetical protein
MRVISSLRSKPPHPQSGTQSRTRHACSESGSIFERKVSQYSSKANRYSSDIRAKADRYLSEREHESGFKTKVARAKVARYSSAAVPNMGGDTDQSVVKVVAQIEERPFGCACHRGPPGKVERPVAPTPFDQELAIGLLACDGAGKQEVNQHLHSIVARNANAGAGERRKANSLHVRVASLGDE